MIWSIRARIGDGYGDGGLEGEMDNEANMEEGNDEDEVDLPEEPVKKEVIDNTYKSVPGDHIDI